MKTNTTSIEWEKRYEILWHNIPKMYGTEPISSDEMLKPYTKRKVRDFIRTLLQSQRDELFEEAIKICEEVRTECRHTDDEWDRGDECERISWKLATLREQYEK